MDLDLDIFDLDKESCFLSEDFLEGKIDLFFTGVCI